MCECISAACIRILKSDSKLGGQLSKLGFAHTHMPIANVLLSRRSIDERGVFFSTRADYSTDVRGQSITAIVMMNEANNQRENLCLPGI